jgi:fatty acyl-CoA reductase
VLEKLIRTVPDLGGVILLIRGGEKGDARERFERQIATSSIFDPLRAERGAWLERFFAEQVECVTGEVTEPISAWPPRASMSWPRAPAW